MQQTRSALRSLGLVRLWLSTGFAGLLVLALVGFTTGPVAFGLALLLAARTAAT